MANANELTFGIEIECFIPADAFQREGWRRGGYHSGAPIPGFAGWRCDADASLQATGNTVAVELVSPVLRGAAGMAEVRRMAAQLAVFGATVNRSCGFHVHVGWPTAQAGGDFAALRRLVCLVAQHEKALFAAAGRGREGNHYCPSIRERLRAIEGMTTVEQLAQGGVPRATLNLQHIVSGGGYGSHRTVEFRVFSGTTSAVKMAAYIGLALGLTHRALDMKVAVSWDAKGKALRLRKGEGLNAMTRLFGALGWTSHLGVKAVHGVISSELEPLADAPTRRVQVTQGVVVDAADTHHLRTRKELQRLAKKYDASAPAAVPGW